MRKHSIRVLAASALLALCAVGEAVTPAALPIYKAAPCCTLCPRAADPEVYVTRFMATNRLTIQGRDDWLFRSEVDLDTQFALDEGTFSELARLVKRLNARGTQVLLLDLPRRGMLTFEQLLPAERSRYDIHAAVANYRRTLQRFRDIGFIVPDYGQLVEKPDGTEYFFRRDTHWTPEGARRTADLIAETVKTMPMYAKFPQKAFATRRQGQQQHPGTLAIVASQICGGDYPSEIIHGYSTVPNENNLFGDNPLPEIALVGTSYSATPGYHFLGFLQQALQTDVLNVALTGGNYDGALTQYLPSDAFQDSPPKLLIWEFAHPQIAAVSPAQLRRLLPLVENGCVDRDPLLTNEARIASGDELTEVLFNGGGRILQVPSRELIVDLQFADPAVSEIVAETWYLDGRHDVLRVHLNDYTRANGRFALELNRSSDFAEQPLIDVRVQVLSPLAAPTSVKASLCRNTPRLMKRKA